MPLRRADRQRRSSSASDSSQGSDRATAAEQGSHLNDTLLVKVDPIYLNQPIDIKQGETKLRAPIAQLNQLEKKLKETRILLENVASEFATSLQEEVRGQEFQEDRFITLLMENATMKSLEAEYRSVSEKIEETHIRSAVLSDIRQRICQGHKITNLWEKYQRKADEALVEYQSRSRRDKFLKDKEYVGFMTLVWEEFSGGKPMPNLKKFLPKDPDQNGTNGAGTRGEGQPNGGGEEEDSDEELEIGAQSTDFRCPLTAATLEDPYTSTECPHSFSGDAIKDYINSVPSKEQACPVAGCSKKLTLAKIERDDALRKRVESHLRRQQQATQEGGVNGHSVGATGGRTYIEMEDSDED